MARTVLAILNKDGVIESIQLSAVCRVDYLINILEKYYRTEERVRRLINLGDLYSLGIEPQSIDMIYHTKTLKNICDYTISWKSLVNKENKAKYNSNIFINLSLEEFIRIYRYGNFSQRDIYIFDVEKSAWFLETNCGLMNISSEDSMEEMFDCLEVNQEQSQLEYEDKEALKRFESLSELFKEEVKPYDRCIKFIDSTLNDLRWKDNEIPQVNKIKAFKPDHHLFPNNRTLSNNGANILLTSVYDGGLEIAERLKWIRNSIKQGGKFILSGATLRCYDLRMGKDSSGWTRYCDAYIRKTNVRDSNAIILEINCNRKHC